MELTFQRSFFFCENSIVKWHQAGQFLCKKGSSIKLRNWKKFLILSSKKFSRAYRWWSLKNSLTLNKSSTSFPWEEQRQLSLKFFSFSLLSLTQRGTFFSHFVINMREIFSSRTRVSKAYKTKHDYELQLINAESVIVLTNEVISHTDNSKGLLQFS